MLAAQTSYDAAKSMYQSGLHSIEGAKASSSQARDQLSKTTIFSPLNGVVTVLNSKLGERVVATNQFAGTEVMRVADLNHMQAVVDVNENDVVHVKLGDSAKVPIDAYGNRNFKGTVEEIANTGTTTGTGTQEEVTNFQVKIRSTNPACACARAQLHRRYPDPGGERCGLRPDPERDHPDRRQPT